eukprot:1012288-Prymnesium_polylepis.2
MALGGWVEALEGGMVEAVEAAETAVEATVGGRAAERAEAREEAERGEGKEGAVVAGWVVVATVVLREEPEVMVVAAMEAVTVEVMVVVACLQAVEGTVAGTALEALVMDTSGGKREAVMASTAGIDPSVGHAQIRADRRSARKAMRVFRARELSRWKESHPRPACLPAEAAVSSHFDPPGFRPP